MSFVSNPQLDLALEYIRHTRKNVFLTGKAGTGKTTFLHKIKEQGLKRMVVTAPTGVAAINAGGMTLHSFFQLPLGLHLPGMLREINNQRRFSRDKIQLIRALDLLVIDEISMVRADLLDAVDDVLRRYREAPIAFGGVQLLMIGDLHQLADKFAPQLQSYFSQPELPEENESLRERLRKAGSYFSSKLNSELLAAVKRIDLITDDRAVLKRARQLLQNLENEILKKHACFVACQSGFSASGYIRAKTNEELESRDAKDVRSAAAAGIPKDTPHPDLYMRLLEWREALADELDASLHEVLPTRSLQEVVRLLPRDRASLKGIPGIGKSKLKRFGEDLAGIVRRYCAEQRIAAPKPEPSKGEPSKVNTRKVSFDLYKSGKTIAEIAAARNLAVNTIEGHLSYFIARRERDISK